MLIGSAMKSSKNGLTEVGRALQKHIGRKGSSFSDIKWSAKTGDADGLRILTDIISSNNKLIKDYPNGTRSIFDLNTGRGFNISREGKFNGFRDIKEETVQ